MVFGVVGESCTFSPPNTAHIAESFTRHSISKEETSAIFEKIEFLLKLDGPKVYTFVHFSIFGPNLPPEN